MLWGAWGMCSISQPFRCPDRPLIFCFPGCGEQGPPLHSPGRCYVRMQAGVSWWAFLFFVFLFSKVTCALRARLFWGLLSKKQPKDQRCRADGPPFLGEPSPHFFGNTVVLFCPPCVVARPIVNSVTDFLHLCLGVPGCDGILGADIWFTTCTWEQPTYLL